MTHETTPRVTLIVSVIVGFVAVMSGWNEHPNPFWRAVRFIGVAMRFYHQHAFGD